MLNNAISNFKDTTKKIEELKRLPDSTLTTPIQKDKWSIREIIGHVYYWDKFNLEKMVPFMLNDAILQAFPDHDLHNKEALEHIDKFESVEQIIDTFVSTRRKLAAELSSIDEDVEFQIENEPIEFTVESFVSIFIEHDSHHLQQIDNHLKNREFN
ncbi:DinB family protein [Virgibacillus flavescens]|uniref:DinB family protein n=1 Tax=Virgibacillus flavescens TaxID=1611422 RepID=UPI003D334DEF